MIDRSHMPVLVNGQRWPSARSAMIALGLTKRSQRRKPRKELRATGRVLVGTTPVERTP